jgi:hypothetical protein
VTEKEDLHRDQHMQKSTMPGKNFLEKQEKALILALFLVLVHRPRRKVGLHHPLIKTNLAIERKEAVLIKKIALLKSTRLPKPRTSSKGNIISKCGRLVFST